MTIKGNQLLKIISASALISLVYCALVANGVDKKVATIVVFVALIASIIGNEIWLRKKRLK